MNNLGLGLGIELKWIDACQIYHCNNMSWLRQHEYVGSILLQTYEINKNGQTSATISID